MFPQRKINISPMTDIVSFLYSDGNQLSENEKKKCHEKFQSFKALGSTVISKNQLKKVISGTYLANADLGKKVSEEELFEMIEQADPNGYGYVSYEAFQKLVEIYKSRKEQQSTQSIELTFQEILKAEKKSTKIQYLTKISWQFLQKYLLEHFQLQINIKAMKGSNSTDSLGRQEFKFLFS